MKKFLRRVLLPVAVVILSALPARALTLGTFNIEWFNISGKKAYVQSDLQHLAGTIRKSGADLLTLQEIEGNATMRYFTAKALKGWRYVGNDTGRRQDLYFLWNPRKVTMLGNAQVYYVNASWNYLGKTRRLFTRPPLVARFRDNATGKNFSVINVHFKSMSTRGKNDKKAATLYNNAKRATQIERVNKLAHSLKGPVFIMGDYNYTNPRPMCKFPILTLKNGYTYDNMKSNLDYIGYVGIRPNGKWRISETESRIPRRSTKRSQHPDHDILTLDLGENW